MAYYSIEEGLDIVIGHIKQLRQERDGLVHILVTGEAGAGKSFFARTLEHRAEKEQLRAIRIELDLYNEDDVRGEGVEKLTPDFLRKQLQDLKEGNDVTYFNTETAHMETRSHPIDVVILEGIDNPLDNSTVIDNDMQVDVRAPFKERMANKLMRDGTPSTFKRFLVELAQDTDNDLLAHTLQQEAEGKAKSNSADVIVHNTQEHNVSPPRLWIEEDELKFSCVYKGETFAESVPIDEDRLERLQNMLDS